MRQAIDSAEQAALTTQRQPARVCRPSTQPALFWTASLTAPVGSNFQIVKVHILWNFLGLFTPLQPPPMLYTPLPWPGPWSGLPPLPSPATPPLSPAVPAPLPPPPAHLPSPAPLLLPF